MFFRISCVFFRLSHIVSRIIFTRFFTFSRVACQLPINVINVAFRHQSEIIRTKNIYWSLLKEIAWICLYFRSQFLCRESPIYRRVHMHVSRRVNRPAIFLHAARSGISRWPVRNRRVRTDEALFHLRSDGMRARQFDDITRKSAPVAWEHYMHEHALGCVSRFQMLRFCKLDKFAAANYFAENTTAVKTVARAFEKGRYCIGSF